MGNRLYDAFELCLQSLEKGESVEACLKRFPDLADELRPMLYAADQALDSAALTIPHGIAASGRARLLRQAAEMREAAARPRYSRFQLRKLAYVFALLVIFLTSGTGLVQASNGALPGDNLYKIKRTWEDVRLLLAFNPITREALEELYEDERYEEIFELFEEGRMTDITFSGIVTDVTESLWTVSNIPVRLDASTSVAADIKPGDVVLVRGVTQPQVMQVLAKDITFSNGGALEVVDDEDEHEDDEHTSATSTPRPPARQIPTDGPALTPTPQPTPTPDVVVKPTKPGPDDDENDDDGKDGINNNDNDDENENKNDNKNENKNDNDDHDDNDNDHDNDNHNDNDNTNNNDNDND